MELKRKFEVKSIGNPNLILGMKFTQGHFVEDLLQKFGLDNANPVSTLMDPNINLDATEDPENDKTLNNKISDSYVMLIGSLMYLALATRPDISYTVN